MAQRPALVLGSDNLPQQLQAGDTLAGPNVKFTASTTLPLVTVSAGAVLILTVAPVVSGNSLAAGESITVQPTVDLPAGLNLAWWYASGINTVRVGLSVSANLALSSTTYTWLVTAHR